MAFAFQKLGVLLPFVPKESKSASYHLCVLREQVWGEHSQFPSKELRNHCSRSAYTEEDGGGGQILCQDKENLRDQPQYLYRTAPPDSLSSSNWVHLKLQEK